MKMKAITYKDETMGADYEVGDIPITCWKKRSTYREKLIEKVSEADDKLLESTSAAKPSPRKRSRRRCADGHIESVRKEEAPFVPVICGTRVQEQGRAAAARRGRRLPAVAHRNPRSAGHRSCLERRGAIERKADERQPFAALAFKIMTDPFVGQLTFFRVYSGTLTTGTSVFNSTKGKTERIGRLLKMHANKREEIKEVYAGDIAAAVGLSRSPPATRCATRRSRCCSSRWSSPSRSSRSPSSRRPKPTRKSSGKDGQADGRGPDLPRQHRRADRSGRHRGMGELHLEIIVDRLKREFGVEASVGKPQVAYRKRSRPCRRRWPFRASDRRPRPVRARQDSVDPAAAGHRLSVRERDRRRLRATRYIKPIDQGIQEALTRGVLAGYPIDDVRIELFDGSFHEVDRRKWRSRSPARWRSRTRRRKRGPC